MELISKDSIFDEAFKIISTNKLKANSLRQSLLQNNNHNDELNLKTIQFLGEIEYDLKSLYDILRDLKISYNDMPNNLIHSSFRNNRIKEENEKNEKVYNDFDKINNKLKEPSKTYYITSNKFENNSESNNNDNKDYYMNSCPRPEKYRNISFNSYEGNYNLNLSPLSHRVNSLNNKQDKEYDKYLNDIQQNDKGKNIIDKDLPFKKKYKLNFDYDNYLTDYSLNKTNRNDPSNNNERNSNYNDPGQNLNLSDLKNDNNFDNNKNNNYNNTSNFVDNKNYSIKNKLDNENIFTFGSPKNNNQNLNNNNVLTFNPNLYQNNNNNLYEKNQEYNEGMNNNRIKYSYNDFINNKYNKNENSNNKIEEEDIKNIEGEKKEILNKIIPDVFQDKTKLYLLKSELGDDIEEKLLNGNISEEDLYKVVKILKNNQDLKNNKGKKMFQKKKFNQPSDKILLKESLKDKRYSYREFPRGWNSTKDYFVNNGTTSLNYRKGKNYLYK